MPAHVALHGRCHSSELGLLLPWQIPEDPTPPGGLKQEPDPEQRADLQTTGPATVFRKQTAGDPRTRIPPSPPRRENAPLEERAQDY